jgi:tRNA (adenine37-N6)-methyltransferase
MTVEQKRSRESAAKAATDLTTDSPDTTSRLQHIGYIESCFRAKFGTPRQSGLAPSSWSRLALRRDLNMRDGLIGLDSFSHLWIVFLFHKNTNKGFNAKVHPPRLNGESIGVFATRSPHRPNPIGLSIGKIEKVGDNEIYLSGLDIIDGTPVLDIKPYLQSADLPKDPILSGWTTTLDPKKFAVDFSPSALQDIARLISNSDQARFTRLIDEILSLDPRPGFYKGSPARPDPYTDTYGFLIDDWNVVYKIKNDVAEVVKIEPRRPPSHSGQS